MLKKSRTDFFNILLCTHHSGGIMFWTTVAHAMGGAGGTAAQPGGEAALFGNLGFIVILFAIFYFLLIRPQQKRQKEHKAMISGVKRGDEIITAGGLYGRVVETADEYVVLDLGDSKVKMNRSAISVVRANKPAEKDKKDDK
jgi:preprotein translocase subunit YajC